MTTVTRDGWNVSCTTGSGIIGARLSVFKVVSEHPWRVRYGDAQGRVFKSTDDAFKFALERGYLQTYVHETCTRCRHTHWWLGTRTNPITERERCADYRKTGRFGRSSFSRDRRERAS